MNLLRDLMDRFDLLSLRERGFVGIALVLGIALIWDTLFMGPLDRRARGHKQQVEVLRAEVSGLEKSVQTLVAQGAADPEKQGRDKVEALHKEIAGLDAQLAGATSGLIAPKEMAHVLEQLLQRTSHLTLIALRTLPPQSIVTAPAGQPQVAGAAQAQIYRHGVEIEVGGTYLESLAFLQALETLPWRFFWERVEYQVEQYPQGRLKLTVFTLGLKEGWIGV